MTDREMSSGGPGNELPAKKRTSVGLYVTAGEAFEMWKADPGRVKVVDVRTPEEYLFVGHAPMAVNIPIGFVKYQWDVAKHEPVLEPNAEFIACARRRFEAGDTLLVTCRSGGRSAVAVNALAKAGFARAFNVVDGMEGDLVDDPGSAYHGKRMKNGWKNSGAPWTYDVDPELLWSVPVR